LGIGLVTQPDRQIESPTPGRDGRDVLLAGDAEAAEEIAQVSPRAQPGPGRLRGLLAVEPDARPPLRLDDPSCAVSRA
jgi:hypothetical protein